MKRLTLSFGLIVALAAFQHDSVQADSQRSRAQELSDQAYQKLSDDDYAAASDLYAQAIADWQNVLEANPDDADAKRELDRCRQNYVYSLGHPLYIAMDKADDHLDADEFAEAARLYGTVVEGYEAAHLRLGHEEFAQNLNYARSKHVEARFAAAIAAEGEDAIGKAVAAAGDLYAKQVAELRKLLDENPENEEAREQLSRYQRALTGAVGSRCFTALDEGDDLLKNEKFAEAARRYKFARDAYEALQRRLGSEEIPQNLTYARQQYGIASFQDALANRGLAHAFELDSFGRGRIRLSDFRGKAVLVAIWSAGCGYCQVEIPALQQFYDRHRNEGLAVIALNGDPVWDGERAPEAKEMVTNLTFPIAWATQDTINHFGGGSMSLPAMFWIDPEGRLAKVVEDRDQGQLARDFAEFRPAPDSK